jgi:flagellar protein FlbD
MIALKRLNNQEFVLNADHIETVEATPDTVISLANGKKYIVKDSVDEVVRKIVEFRRSCNGVVRVNEQVQSSA